MYCNVEFDCPQKNDKTSPRWQHSDMYMKEHQQKSSIVGSGSGDTHPFDDHRPANGGSNLMMEDERDPDVIPAQFGKEFRTFLWNNINQSIFIFSSQ